MLEKKKENYIAVKADVLFFKLDPVGFKVLVKYFGDGLKGKHVRLYDD